MRHRSTNNWRRQAFWGVVLIAVGAGFLLDQVHLLDLDRFWHYWPLLFVLSGVGKMIGYPTARGFLGGVWSILFGLWLYAVLEGMYGLTWSNSWPFLLIFWGLQLVLEPLLDRYFAGNKELNHE